MTGNSNKSGMAMGMPLAWAEWLSFWSNWTLVGALIVGVLATYGIVVSGNVKEAALKLELAEAGKTAESAKADAAKANEGASRANERSALLEKEAADARLATEKIKEVVAWRTISPSESAELVKNLATKPGAVNLRWMDGDPESLFLAIQLSQILGKAGWQIAPGALKPANTIVFGIRLPDDVGESAIMLRNSISESKIPFDTNPVPSGPSFNVSMIAGAPMLMIGSRPPPQLPP